MKLGKRTAQLVREAAVLGFAEGARWAGYHHTSAEDRANYPRDSVVLADALRSARSFSDLYPTLARVEREAP